MAVHKLARQLRHFIKEPPHFAGRDFEKRDTKRMYATKATGEPGSSHMTSVEVTEDSSEPTGSS